MAFDFPHELPAGTGPSDRQRRGAVAYHKGLAAEDQVARLFCDRGMTLLHKRWRGRGGEIDLIFQNEDEIVFVEVKSSRTHARALQQLSQRQLHRLTASAEDFLGTCPKGSLTPMRLDVAMVDGQGEIEILENALLMM